MIGRLARLPGRFGWSCVFSYITNSMQKIRLLKDLIISKLMLLFTVASVSVLFIIGIGLYYKSIPLLNKLSWVQLLTTSVWKPFKGLFGFFPYIMGTLWVTGIAITIALPLCVLTSLYIIEYAPGKLRRMLMPFVNLLSGIPPVIFGVWAYCLLSPLSKNLLLRILSIFQPGIVY